MSNVTGILTFPALFERTNENIRSKEWNESKLYRLVPYGDHYNRAALSKYEENPRLDLFSSLVLTGVWDEYLKNHISYKNGTEHGAHNPEDALVIVNSLLSLPELARFNVANPMAIVDFWAGVQHSAPTEKCATNPRVGGTVNNNNDNAMVRFVKAENIPIPFKLISMTAEQLRFLVYNSRRSLVSNLFNNNDAGQYVPVYNWLTAGADGIDKVVRNPTEVS